MIAAEVNSFTYYCRGKRCDSNVLIHKILKAFGKGDGYILKRGCYITENTVNGKLLFRNELISHVKWSLGVHPYLEKNDNGSYTIWFNYAVWFNYARI
jgi:hypothetical protein